MKRSIRVLFVLLLCLARSSVADTAIPIPLGGDGVLDVSKGSVDIKDLVFENGTIEFDMYMPDHGILGMRLRAQNRDNAEVLYFRPQPDCHLSSDCMQYMPLDHGAFEWDLFPEYQTAAPIRTLDWNHFRVVVVGRTMRVYVNHASEPTLSVDHMQGASLAGALTFGGPAKYKNLLVTPTPPSSTTSQAAPARSDRFLRHWQISTASVLPTVLDAKLEAQTGVQPPYASMPPAGEAWRAVTAQAKGLVNFSREVGSAKDGAVTSLAWAKTTLVSDKAQTKTVKLGWVREIWIYVNGKLVFADRNLYGLPAAKVAGGRISLDNGSFRLPLRKGRNEIAIALDDNLPGNTQHFGWGMQFKLKDSSGVSQASDE